MFRTQSPPTPADPRGHETLTQIHSFSALYHLLIHQIPTERTRKKGRTWVWVSRSLILNLILTSEQMAAEGGE